MAECSSFVGKSEELGRNLTSRVYPEVAEQFRLALQVNVDEVDSLQELICPDGSSLPRADQLPRREEMQKLRHFEMVTLDGRCRTCAICGLQFSDTWLLRQHQVDLGHFDTDNLEEVVQSQRNEELLRLQTWQRLNKEIGLGS